MIEEYMTPFKKSIKEDKFISVQMRFDYDKLLERLHELECFAMIQDWKLNPT